MEPVRKQLTCPSCGKTSAVRVMLGSAQHRWHCPECHLLQTTDGATADAAPPAPAG